ncbi:MAG: hypothetical protein FWD93_02745 [Coriobacteriia bacterium]|nr:hypothetical protein [Coriobacteriia bacterium]
MVRVLIIREGILADGTKISDVRLRGRDGDDFVRVNIDDTPETFEAARYALLDNASDEQIAEMSSLVDQWEPGRALVVGGLIAHRGIVYRVLQSHTSQSDWPPARVPALFQVA